MPMHIQNKLNQIHPDTLARYYGCGLCLPDYDMTGLSVLDLGCGAGRDVYLASQLVGPTGRVVGVDMTAAQLTAAREKQDYHIAQFGYDNIEFVQGYLEQLDDVLIGQAGSFDLIISNCVLNLCTDKAKVLSHCHSLLKEGGEFYFSDVYASRRIPTHLRDDPVLYGECLSGALYWNDFQNLARQTGFTDPRLVDDTPITIQNPNVLRKVTGYEFYSATYRLWKRNDLEPDCEDYGQAVIF
jgi:arsenite methyltransferase